MFRHSITRWMYIILSLPIVYWVDVHFNLYSSPFAPFFVYLIVPILFFSVVEAYTATTAGIIMESYLFSKSPIFSVFELTTGAIEILVFASVIIWLRQLVILTKKQSENIRVLERQKASIQAQEEYRRRRDEFLVIAAHELKTPVTVITLYADLINSQYNDLSEIDNATFNIILESEHITKVINDILYRFEPSI